MPHTTDAEHLQFIFNRLKHVYGENPNYDYMLRFQEIITKITPQDQKQQSLDAKDESDEPITLRTCSNAQIKTVMERGLHPTKERRDLIFAAGALGNETLQKELGSMELSDFYDGMLAAGLIDVNPYWPRHKKNG